MTKRPFQIHPLEFMDFVYDAYIGYSPEYRAELLKLLRNFVAHPKPTKEQKT